MKKIIYVLALGVFFFASCGDGAAPEVKLDTKDVKGTINAEGVSTSMTELHREDGVFEVPNVKFNDNCRLQIAPTSVEFDEAWTKKKQSIENFGGEVKVIEKKDGGVIYEEKSEFAGKKKQGYNFIVVIKGKDKNYEITGEGETPFDPIASKEDAEKAYNAARTFKPAE